MTSAAEPSTSFNVYGSNDIFDCFKTLDTLKA